jgi:ketosteroid isomerase-like protein
VLSRELLERTYAAFNARDVDRALATMHPDVEWANGMEGGLVHGRAAVRDYWTRQWRLIDPRAEPLRFEEDGAGRTIVHAHLVVRDPAGLLLRDLMVQHVYTIEAGLIRTMEIRQPA